ncbi:lysophospholipid acyltransferase family protein [Peribacillus huizhouensis]|uniref:lysophospholipid acyltransferase family protein n=1 Tax=Peribacillus huizhouensis TaxID=1501239 RepID=UPI0015FD964F|nr:lysophospholipid acyltransferase family protein [Peribacillus huizhouensis]
MNFYTFAKNVVKIVLLPFYRAKAIGIENIPKEGGVLICSNHINNLDPPIVGIASKRDIHFMAKEELFQIPILKGILPKVHAFPVKRGLSDREALRKGLAVLKEEQVLGLFPEGTRSKDGLLGEGLAGAGFFALRSKAAVLPCAIIGPYKMFRPVKIVFGKPIDFERIREEKVSADDATKAIMTEIQTLINNHK